MKPLNRSHAWLIAAALAAFLAVSSACAGSDDSDNVPPSGEFGVVSSDGDAGNGDESAPSGATTGGEQSSGATQQSQLGRKLIRTATIEIETDSVSQKFEDIGNIAVSSGGLVFSSQFGNDGKRQTASITIRVPNDRYAEVLGQLRRLGEVREEHSNATDVTEEFTDLSSSLTNLQATEREYLELLNSANNVDEILVMQDRINGTRSQIEQVQGRINLIGNQSDYATITTHLMPGLVAASSDDGGRTSVGDVAAEAFDASLAVLYGLAVVTVAIAAFAWWLLPLAAIGVYLGRRQMKQDRARNQAPPPPKAP
jgi:hypothetical protein